MDMSCLLQGHPAIEPVPNPSTHPLVPHSRSKLRLTLKPTRVKSDAGKLSGDGILKPLELNLVILIMQFIVLSEDIGDRAAPTRGNNPDKLADMDDDIRH
jgi:hypothetical protein